MEILGTVGAMQARAEEIRAAGKTISVVPTMGALHEGHTSLVKLARAQSDVVVLTVFVNPTQFGPGEDFERYPRDLAKDSGKGEAAGADILFCPDVKQMYPDGFITYVVTEDVSKIFEGAIRPSHFRGVTTIVAKLFHCTNPHVAVFGEKDAQQLFIIRKMVTDLNFHVKIVGGPIIREKDGLALSSRNAYLDATQRHGAPALYQSLSEARDRILAGERSAEAIRKGMMARLNQGNPTKIDYATLVDPETFRETDLVSGSVLIILAARFGPTRLIDNMLVRVEGR